MSDTVTPVGKITPVSGPAVKPVGKITVVGQEPATSKGFDPLALTPQEQKMKEVGKIVDDLDFTGGYNNDEKKYLVNLAKNPNIDFKTWNDAKLTVGGEHAKQQGQQTYYFDDNGLPVPLAQSERPPKNKQIESVWGSQSAADDDSIMTIIGKNLANTIPDFVQSFGDLIHLPYGVIAGKEADWYKDLKNETDSHRAKVSAAGSQSFLDTENVHNFEDLAKPENWHFTPQNIAGNASQLISTVIQFMGGSAIAKGIGLGAKAAGALESAALAGEEVGIGTKALAKLPYLASSYTNNLATSLEASDAAGIEGREKYAIASLVTLPVAAVESFMGLTGKIAANPAMKSERDAMVKSLIKGWKDDGGQLTKESLKELYDNTVVASSSVMGKMTKEGIVNAAGEASEEVLQDVIQKSSESIYDHLFAQDKEIGKGKYGTDITSPQAFAEYLNDAIAGALGGGIGGAGVDKYKRAKSEIQSANAYEYIKQGPEAVQTLKTSIARARDNGTITPEQYKNAVFKVDTYQKYYDQVKDLNLDDKSNRRISDLTWSNENLKEQQQALMENPESKIKGTIVHRRLLDTEAILEANSKEMSDLMAPKIADQQTAVATEVDEKNAANKKEVLKDKNQESGIVALKEKIRKAETEKDLNAFLNEADKQGITNPEIVDEVGKRREVIKNIVPSTPPVPEVKTENAIPVSLEHADLHSNIAAAKPGKDFNNLLDWDQQDKSDVLVKNLVDKNERMMKNGVLELGLWANKIAGKKKLPIYYDVDFSGKRFKIASSDYTKFIKEKNLTGRKVDVQLVTPEDADLDQLVKDGIIDSHKVVERTDKQGNTGKFFVFDEDEHKQRYPYILVARLQTKAGNPGIKIGNLSTNTYSTATQTPEGREGLRRPKKIEQTAATVENVASEKKTSGEFDRSTAEVDYEAQVQQASGVTVDEEDEGFTSEEDDDEQSFDITPSDKKPQLQKESVLAQESKELRDKKIELLKTALPGITVVEDESIGKGLAGQLDADGKTVRLNPEYNFSDTPIHEFGHALIDIVGMNPKRSGIITTGVNQLRGTKLWDDTKAAYPELSEDMLGKEVLAEAIGREGAKIFDKKEAQSKFKNWLDGFFFKIKKLLGIEKNVAKNLASELLSGKRITSQTEATGEIQKAKIKEEKTIESVKPNSYKKWAATQDFDEFDAKARIADLKESIADAEGEEKNILEGELELLEGSIEDYKDRYQQYLADHKTIVDFVKSKGDVSKMSLDDLNEVRSMMVKYDDFVKTKIYKDLLYNIGVKVNELQSENLKAADPEYDPEKEQSGDLSKSDIWAQGLSTIGEKFPAIQAFYKMYRSAFGTMNQELSKIKTEGHELAQKVIKEYHKTHGVSERLKNFTIGGGNKYFSFLAQDGKLVEKGTSEYKKLTKAQKDLLDFITEKKAGLDQYMEDGGVLLKSGAGFVETFQKSGLFKAYANFITQNHNLRNVKVKYKDPETGKTTEQYFGDVEALLQEFSKKGHIKKVQAMALLTKYNLQAKKGLEVSKGSKGKYFLKPDGTLVSMFGGEFKGDFTENYYETFMKYAQDAVFSKNMSPLMPTLTGVEMFYKSMGSDKENVTKFLDVVKKGKFLQETIESGLGETADKALRLLRKWTSWRFIAFNIPANIWNIAVGEYNQFRADGGKAYLKGKERFLGGLLKGKKNAKSYNILKKYVPDLVTDVNGIDPEKHVGRYFDMLAFGGQKIGEALIRGSAIIGKISTEHYNWFDSQGNIKGSPEQIAEREAIVKAEIEKYVSQVEKVQGRYSDVEKRNFAYFELGQFFGQFKVWMPEWLSDRFAREYIDADGVKRKGSFRTLFGYGMRDFLRDATKKEFYTGTDPKHVAARKQLRGMVITAGLLAAYLGSSDDDDDKEYANQLDKALRNISGIYRMDNNTFLISQPAAAMSVVVDLAKTLNAAVTAQRIKSGENEGDFKALDMAYNLIPANKLLSAPAELMSED